MSVCWPLLVVSAEGQRENLTDYLRMAREDATREGWTLEREGDFSEVASGKKGVRAPMVALVAAVKATPAELRPAWVWMRRVDRVGRGRATESVLALYALHDHGVRIWDHDAGEVRLDDAQGERMAMDRAWYARLDNEIRSGKMKAVYARRRAQGKAISNRRPYGLRVGPNGTDETVPELADAVRQAFTWRVEGHGLHTISNRLATFAPPYRFKDHETPVRWTNKRVLVLLKTPAYIGTIVDEVTWRRAQRVGPSGRGKRQYDYALRGALRCWCGRLMQGGASRKSQDYVWRYYRCEARWAHDGKTRIVAATKLELAFEELLRTISVSPRLRASYRRAQNEVPSASLIASALADRRKRLEAIEKRRSAAWDLHADGKIPDDDLAPRLAQLAVERETLTAQLAELETQEQLIRHARRIERDALELWERAAASYPTATMAEREELARMVAVHFGLCCEPDGALSLRRPIDPGRQQRGVSP